jgi:hypothetical protein
VGPNRVAIAVRQAEANYLLLHITVAYESRVAIDAIQSSVVRALGVETTDGEGMFGSDRPLGEREHATRIEGILQNLAGVRSVRVTALASLGTADDPSTLSAPAAPARAETIACTSAQVLRLARAHLVLTLIAEAAHG